MGMEGGSDAGIRQIQERLEQNYANVPQPVRGSIQRQDLRTLLAHLATVQQERELDREIVKAALQSAVAANDKSEQAEAQLAALTAKTEELRDAMRRFTSDLPNYVKRSSGYKLVRVALAELLALSPVPASSDGHKE